MTEQEQMLAGRRMPVDLTQLVWLVAESRARGVECAADDAGLFGAGEVAEHLRDRATAIREEAVNRPPLELAWQI